jgi:hypothetical protein
MGIAWLLTPRPRPGHEAEYAGLRTVALAELDTLDGFDAPDWSYRTHGLSDAALAAVRRLHAISVYPAETWQVFLGELWTGARARVQRDGISLPTQERALLTLAEIQPVLASLAARLGPEVRFPHELDDRVHGCLEDLLGDCRWGLTRFTTRELHLLRTGWDEGPVWRSYDLAPGIYEVGQPYPVSGATADFAAAAARQIREQVCAALRRIVPALRGLDDAGIEAEFARWGEFRWREWSVSHGRAGELRECSPIEQPAWVETLDELDASGPEHKDRALFTFARHSVQTAIDAFGTAQWMQFWGSRGHGFQVA